MAQATWGTLRKWRPCDRRVESAVSLSAEQLDHDRPSQTSVGKRSFRQLNYSSVTLCSQTVELSGSSANHSPHLASLFDMTVGRSALGWTSPTFGALRAGRSCVNTQCLSFDVRPKWGSDHPTWGASESNVLGTHASSSLSVLKPGLSFLLWPLMFSSQLPGTAGEMSHNQVVGLQVIVSFCFERKARKVYWKETIPCNQE